MTYLKGAGYQGFRAGWHATLRTTTVGLRGGVRHGLYRCEAPQARSIPPIQPRTPTYPQKVKLYPVNSVLLLQPSQLTESELPIVRRSHRHKTDILYVARSPAPAPVTSQALATYRTKHEPSRVIKPQLKFRWICLMNNANAWLMPMAYANGSFLLISTIRSPNL